jgi:broad-specificity NMP kinase
MFRCIAVGGEPATGKTTMMKELYKNMGVTHNLKAGLLRGHINNTTNVSLMGLYNDAGTFLGTDRLSMAVNTDFQKYVKMKKRHIVFEGDRLFTNNNLKFIGQHYELRIIILEASKQELHDRHISRGDGQSDVFLKGRATKIRNIATEFGGKVERKSLTEPAHSIQMAQELLQWLETGK